MKNGGNVSDVLLKFQYHYNQQNTKKTKVDFSFIHHPIFHGGRQGKCHHGTLERQTCSSYEQEAGLQRKMPLIQQQE